MHGTSEKKAWLQMKMIRVREQAQRNALVALCCFLSLASLYRFVWLCYLERMLLPTKAIRKCLREQLRNIAYLLMMSCTTSSL